MTESDALSSKIMHIDHAISPQPHTSIYLMHKWWARKPHNVVGEYVEHYSKKGDVVFDPFCGSGVTVVEALRLGRKAIGVDLDPMATFITWITVTHADIDKLKLTMAQIQSDVMGKIEALYITKCPKCNGKARILATIWNKGNNRPIQLRLYCPRCGKRFRKEPTEEDLSLVEKVDSQKPPYWYPNDKLYYQNGKPFKKKETNETVADLFTNRALIALSILWREIESINIDEETRDFFKFWFTSRVHIVSKMSPIAKPSPKAHWTEDSTTSFWAVHSYWVPPRFMESNVWMVYESGFSGPQGLIRGKTESDVEIRDAVESQTFSDLLKRGNFLLLTKSAISLHEIPDSSVDYCFTDPPYGGSIQYMELSFLWLSWLRGSKSDRKYSADFEDEITINEQQHKNFEYYHKMLKASFEEIYRILKAGKWLTVTFHNTDIKIYNSIIKAVVLAGFDLEKVIYQPPARPSAKGLLQPYGSAVGDYYIRFRKPERKEQLLSESEIDEERYERIVVNTVEHIIAERREPITYSIIINSYPTIFEELKKNGYRFSAPETIEEVLRKYLDKKFVLVDVKDERGRKLGKKWWLKERLYLDRASLSERVEGTIIDVLNSQVVVSFDDILEKIFTRFKNALTPDTQSVKSILEEYAEKTDGRWRLKKEMRLRQTQHNQIIQMLVDLGKKAGFEVYADLPEWRGKLELPLSKEKIDRIREIDALWLKNGEVVYEFEVENTTGISDAIIRGSNIPSLDTKRFIVIPEERQRLLLMKTAEPILRESIEHYKWKIIFYDTIISFHDKNKRKKTLDAGEVDQLSEVSTRKRIEQQTLGQF